jgi:molybdopterin synthase sulfur carrier subunit
MRSNGQRTVNRRRHGPGIDLQGTGSSSREQHEDGDGPIHRTAERAGRLIPMARVVLTKGLTQFTGGQRELELEVSTVRELLRVLGERYPALQPHLTSGLAVAIDGQIYQDAWLEPIPPDSEVYLIPQIAGG